MSLLWRTVSGGASVSVVLPPPPPSTRTIFYYCTLFHPHLQRGILIERGNSTSSHFVFKWQKRAHSGLPGLIIRESCEENLEPYNCIYALYLKYICTPCLVYYDKETLSDFSSRKSAHNHSTRNTSDRHFIYYRPTKALNSDVQFIKVLSFLTSNQTMPSLLIFYRFNTVLDGWLRANAINSNFELKEALKPII